MKLNWTFAFRFRSQISRVLFESDARGSARFDGLLLSGKLSTDIRCPTWWNRRRHNWPWICRRILSVPNEARNVWIQRNPCESIYRDNPWWDTENDFPELIIYVQVSCLNNILSNSHSYTRNSFLQINILIYLLTAMLSIYVSICVFCICVVVSVTLLVWVKMGKLW